MDDLQILSRLILFATFGAAGAAKLRDLAAFNSGLAEFGVPALLRASVTYGLPYAELGLAILLILSTTAWWGAVAAMGLLVPFTLAIAGHLLQGRRPGCSCFGQAHAKPISLMTLVRNLTLMFCALFLIIPGPHADQLSVPIWFVGLINRTELMTFVLLLLSVMLVVGAWLLFHLIRQQGRLILRIDNLELRLDRGGVESNPAPNIAIPEGLDVGTLAPGFVAPGLDAGLSSLGTLLQHRRPLILVFSDPQCGPCNAMAPRLEKWQKELKSKLTVAVVSRGNAEQNLAKLGSIRLKNVFLQVDREIAYIYKAFVTPSAVRVNASGLIDSHLAVGDVAIDDLVQETLSMVPIELPVVPEHHQVSERHTIA